MAFYVTAIVVTLHVNNFTNTVIPTYFQFIQMPNFKNKMGYFAS